MSQGWLLAALIAISAQSALAQPGQPPQQGYPQPSLQQQPMQQLTVDEQWLLERGYFSQGEHIGGGLTALVLGAGIGHAIQGRWGDKGWIFTLGEGAAFAVMVFGLSIGLGCPDGPDSRDSNCDEGALALMAGGGVVFGALRIWEAVDAFMAPSSHNRRVRQLRARLGLADMRLMPYVAPSRDGDRGVVGVSLRF